MNSEIVDEQFFRTLECRRTSALVQQDLPVIEALHAPETLVAMLLSRIGLV